MRNFKKNIYPVLFLAVIICMNQILILALKPCTNFRNDIHKLETNHLDYVDVTCPFVRLLERGA